MKSETRKVSKLTDNKFVNIYSVEDSEFEIKGYQYAERRGIDSVAFICYDSSRKEQGYLLNLEYTPPTNQFLFRAFGGSFDKDKIPVEIVIDEVKEECGFKVKAQDCLFLGKVFVSTQMNQYCHLYLVNVNSLELAKREPENKVEAVSCPNWRLYEDIIDGDDWKSIAIISKYLNYNKI